MWARIRPGLMHEIRTARRLLAVALFVLCALSAAGRPATPARPATPWSTPFNPATTCTASACNTS